MTEKRFTDRKMIKNLGVSFCATKKDELRLSDPNRVDGWSVKHLLTNEVCFSLPLYLYSRKLKIITVHFITRKIFT